MEKYKNTFALFILSIPVFFITSIAALYFIHIQEWVVTKGRIIPENESQIFLSEKAQLKELNVQSGEKVSKGQTLALFFSSALEEQILNKEFSITENKNQQVRIDLEIETIQATPPEDNLIAAKEQIIILEEKVQLLEKRLHNMQTLSDKGVLSKMEIEDTELKLNDAKQNLVIVRIRANHNPLLLKELEIKRATQEKENLKNEYEALLKQLHFLNKKKELLTIISQVDGTIIHSNLKQLGQYIDSGTLLFQIATNDNRLIEINVKEKEIIQIKKDMIFRFEPDAISVFEYDYFWGDINQIIPSPQNNQISPYIVFGRLTKYGQTLIQNEQTQMLPIGSTGKVYIALGKKSLLLQLIGWN